MADAPALLRPAMPGAELSEDDRRAFPIEDASTNCAGRGMIAGLFGTVAFLNFPTLFCGPLLTPFDL